MDTSDQEIPDDDPCLAPDDVFGDTPPPYATIEPGTSIGRYALERRCDEGGFAEVWEANDTKLNRKIAVKLALKEGKGAKQRFVEEAGISASLQHPSILPVYDRDELDERPFFTMPLINKDTTLLKKIEEGKTLEDRLKLVPHVTSVANALAYAHNKGIIHRDLKPANVMIGEFDETYVIDWGLAKRADEPSGGRAGTLPYMAPEQLSRGKANEKTDIYALGAMLYHVLAGEPPYKGGDVEAKAKSGLPRDIMQLQPELDLDLAFIVRKAMKRSPDERFSTAGELAEDLRKFQAKQIVRPVGLPERVWHWVKNHRAISLLGAALVVVLAVGLILYGTKIKAEQQKAASERDRATAERDRAEKAEREQRARRLATEAEALIERNPLAAARRIHESIKLANLPYVERVGRHWMNRRLDRLLPHGHEVRAIAWSPDGEWLASSSPRSGVRLWSTHRWTARSLAIKVADSSTHLFFTPDSKKLVFDVPGGIGVAEIPEGLVVGDAIEPQSTWEYIPANMRVTTIALGPGPRQVMIGAFWSAVRKNQTHLLNFMNAANNAVLVMGDSLNDDGKVVPGSHWGYQQRALPPHDETIRKIATSPDGANVAVLMGQTGRIYVHATKDRKDIELSPNVGASRSFSWTEDGLGIVAAYGDGRVLLWRDASKPKSEKLLQYPSPIGAVAVAKSSIALGAEDGTIFFVKPGEREPYVARAAFEALYDTMKAQRHVRKAGTYWVHKETKSITQYSAIDNRGAETAFPPISAHIVPSSILWSPRGSELAVIGNEGSVRIYQPGKRVAHPLTMRRHVTVYDEHIDLGIRSIRWSPNGAYAGVGRGDGLVVIYPADEFRSREGETEVTKKPGCSGTQIPFSQRGSQTRMVSEDCDQPLIECERHEASVSRVAWSPDGRYIASGDLTGNVRVWEVANVCRQLNTMSNPGVSVFTLAWSPKGDRLAASFGDGAVFVWRSEDAVRPSWGGANGRLQGGAQVITWGPDQETLIGYSMPHALKAHTALFEQIALWPKGGGTPTIVPLHSSTGEVELDSDDAPHQIALQPNSTKIAVSSKFGVTSLIDVDAMAIQWRVRDNTTSIDDMAWNEQGDRLAQVGRDGTIRVLDPFAGEMVFRQETGLEHGGTVAWDPKGKSLYVGGASKSLQALEVPYPPYEDLRDALGSYIAWGDRVEASMPPSDEPIEQTEPDIRARSSPSASYIGKVPVIHAGTSTGLLHELAAQSSNADWYGERLMLMTTRRGRCEKMEEQLLEWFGTSPMQEELWGFRLVVADIDAFMGDLQALRVPIGGCPTLVMLSPLFAPEAILNENGMTFDDP